MKLLTSFLPLVVNLYMLEIYDDHRLRAPNNGKWLRRNDDQWRHLIRQNDQSVNDAYLYHEPNAQRCLVKNKMRVSTKPTTKSNVWKETLPKVLGHETVYKGVDTAEKNKNSLSMQSRKYISKFKCREPCRLLYRKKF